MNNWRKIVVSPELSIIEAMKVIDKAASQFVMVLDESDRILGVVTDGDIRRGILKEINLQEPVNKVMNVKPRYLPNTTSKLDALSFLKDRHITHVPLVDSDLIVSGVISIDERDIKKDHNYTAVIMVGGLGSRLGDLTLNCPKPMLPINGQPVLKIILDNLIEHGFHNFIFCVNYKAEMIEAYFGNGSKWDVDIQYVREDKRMGTAGALSLLPKTVTGPLLVMNGDIITRVNVTKMLEFHFDNKSPATMGVRNYELQVPFGVIKENNGRITEIDEKPLQRFIVSAGIYLLDNECLKHIPNGEYMDMPHFFQTIIEKDKQVQAFPIHEYWIDIGREADLTQAQQDFTNEDR
jgi:dTDP-glucose pyrophosphorylase